MNNRWETFEGQQFKHTARKDPPVAVEQHLHRSGPLQSVERHAIQIIGIQPTDERRRNAFVVKKHGSAGSYRRISAAAFCQHFRLRFDRTMLFDQIDIDSDGVMLLDLGKTIEIAHGAR